MFSNRYPADTGVDMRLAALFCLNSHPQTRLGSKGVGTLVIDWIGHCSMAGFCQPLSARFARFLPICLMLLWNSCTLRADHAALMNRWFDHASLQLDGMQPQRKSMVNSELAWSLKTCRTCHPLMFSIAVLQSLKATFDMLWYVVQYTILPNYCEFIYPYIPTWHFLQYEDASVPRYEDASAWHKIGFWIDKVSWAMIQTPKATCSFVSGSTGWLDTN